VFEEATLVVRNDDFATPGLKSEINRENAMFKLGLAVTAIIGLTFPVTAQDVPSDQTVLPPATGQNVPPEAAPSDPPRNGVPVHSGTTTGQSVPGQALHTDPESRAAGVPTRPCSPESQAQTPPRKSPGGEERHVGPSHCPR
jgi:hypothetical protein